MTPTTEIDQDTLAPIQSSVTANLMNGPCIQIDNEKQTIHPNLILAMWNWVMNDVCFLVIFFGFAWHHELCCENIHDDLLPLSSPELFLGETICLAITYFGSVGM